MSQSPDPSALAEPLITPTEAEWRAMPPLERERFLIHVNAVLSDEGTRSFMSEGQPHKRAKNRALDRLGQYLRRSGRKIYLADEMSVLYPGERPFEPDVLAVIDVADPGDDDMRMAWVVADEGRGLDWVLEIHYRGDRNKDLDENVKRYARLGISEYFVYDRLRQMLKAWRLPDPGARSYQPVKGHFGRIPSQVLGLELAVIGGRLRFFAGDAELPGADDLIDQLGRMVEELQERNEAAEASAEEQRARAEEQRARAERAEARALEEQRSAVLSILATRGVPVSDPVRAALHACADREKLARFITRAVTAATDVAVLEEGNGG